MKRLVILLMVFCVACTPEETEKQKTDIPASNNTVIIEEEPTTETALEQVDELYITENAPGYDVPTSPLVPFVYARHFQPGHYSLEEAFPALTFSKPVLVLSTPAIRDRLFVVEKKGVIRMFENQAEVTSTEVLLDISDQVSSSKSEEGLLGVAFHPKLLGQPYLYVYYTAKKKSVISRFTFNADYKNIDPDSESVILSFSQPYSNHNGGNLSFGSDGYLYIGVGDGGSSGDPQNNGQNLKNYLGTILRIDVSELAYRIPATNPFYQNEAGYLEEIYAYGLRNPWRFSYDTKRQLWLIADVGQDRIEEIDILKAGGNYGWPAYEGDRSYKSLEISGTVEPPIHQYTHAKGESITGGYTYYGSATSGLYGAYVYGDFISGRIWALWLAADGQVQNVEVLDTSLNIASFGLDCDDELLIVDYKGKLYHLKEEAEAKE